MRTQYYFLGSLILIMGGFVIFVALMAHSAPPSHIYIFLSCGIIAFCMGYLHPQIVQKDERMKMIRSKGLFVTFLAMMIYFIILSGLIQFQAVSLSALDALNILMALIISTNFVSWVVLAKIY